MDDDDALTLDDITREADPPQHTAKRQAGTVYYDRAHARINDALDLVGVCARDGNNQRVSDQAYHVGMIRATIAATTLLLLAGCGSSGPPDVDWSKYPPSSKALIAADTKAKDCAALQDKFDAFDKAGNAADLITYIDWQMGKAGCH